MTTKTINNIKIRRGKVKPFECVAPGGRILEEFTELASAEQWCRETTDFRTKEPKP